MKIVYFTHSLTSCWNHGNAHFLRGVLRELMELGHEVVACQPSDAWSLANLLADHGEAALEPFRAAYPELRVVSYAAEPDPQELLDGAALAIVHEWTEPALVAALGRYGKSHPGLRLLFHDTHHRAVSEPDAMRVYDLSGYDAVLAFGASLAEVYRSWGWGERAFIWHEAADTRHFRPPPSATRREGLVWIGNWGDGERTAEIESFLLAPAAAAGLSLDIHGVRYPASADRLLARYGAHYRGWLANAAVPATFARHLATVHVPRRYYASALPGIPTIRVFEALACGIPLVTAPWQDSEHLFDPGRDYLVAADGAEMTRHLRDLREDAALRSELAGNGLATIEARHSCAHRARELLAITARLGREQAEVAA
ncbi:glycosyltransferase [Bosea sp. CS1GBMeth4]|uniref:CgeB family protein n=1 Tax=Bosea sp. CS1GBMeth4 TaxID=1892849 RepID=UPI001644FAD8|nr:glycosyltransferase [Bosea sp. CS1GBMeth4]